MFVFYIKYAYPDHYKEFDLKTIDFICDIDASNIIYPPSWRERLTPFCNHILAMNTLKYRLQMQREGINFKIPEHWLEEVE